MVIRNTRHEGFATLDDSELDVVAGGWGPSVLSSAMQLDSSFAASAEIAETLYAEPAQVSVDVAHDVATDYANAYSGIVQGLGFGFGPNDAAMLAEAAPMLEDENQCHDDDDCEDDDDDCDD
jgi:hypothetical protein